jgi:hypothetical protein
VTSRFLLGILLAIFVGLSGYGMDTAAADSFAEMKAQVFRYLDSADGEEAAGILQGILSNPNATIDQVIGIIQTEPAYAPQPTGAILGEQVDVQGRVYNLALSVPSTYQPAKSYGLVLCLHGAGFTGEAYLERWQARLGEDYVLACPTTPMGGWFARGAEELAFTEPRIR